MDGAVVPSLANERDRPIELKQDHTRGRLTERTPATIPGHGRNEYKRLAAVSPPTPPARTSGAE